MNACSMNRSSAPTDAPSRMPSPSSYVDASGNSFEPSCGVSSLTIVVVADVATGGDHDRPARMAPRSSYLPPGDADDRAAALGLPTTRLVAPVS